MSVTAWRKCLLNSNWSWIQPICPKSKIKTAFPPKLLGIWKGNDTRNRRNNCSAEPLCHKTDAHVSCCHSNAQSGVLSAAVWKHFLQEGEEHRPGLHAREHWWAAHVCRVIFDCAELSSCSFPILPSTEQGWASLGVLWAKMRPGLGWWHQQAIPKNLSPSISSCRQMQMSIRGIGAVCIAAKLWTSILLVILFIALSKDLSPRKKFMLKSVCLLWLLRALLLPMIRALEPSTTSMVQWLRTGMLHLEQADCWSVLALWLTLNLSVPAVQSAFWRIYFFPPTQKLKKKIAAEAQLRFLFKDPVPAFEMFSWKDSLESWHQWEHRFPGAAAQGQLSFWPGSHSETVPNYQNSAFWGQNCPAAQLGVKDQQFLTWLLALLVLQWGEMMGERLIFWAFPAGLENPPGSLSLWKVGYGKTEMLFDYLDFTCITIGF